MIFRKTIRKLVAFLGYEIRRKPPKPFRDRKDLKKYDELFEKESLQTRRFYNVGAGSFYHPYWTNIDKLSDWYAASQHPACTIDVDLLDEPQWPLEDHVGEIVYSSHTLEHITDSAAKSFFREAYRILKPGGVIRLTMPDADLLVNAYRRSDPYFDYMVGLYDTVEKARKIGMDRPATQLSRQQRLIWRIATNASEACIEGDKQISDQELDKLFDTGHDDSYVLDCLTAMCDLDVHRENPGHHINWWNEYKLRLMLNEAGFVNFRRSGYLQSFCPVLRNQRFFDNTHPEMSIYVEAEKDV